MVFRIVATPRFIPVCISRCGLFALAGFALLTLPAWSQDSSGSSALRGTVRDSEGKPIAAVTVHLETQKGAASLTSHTDAQGNYNFSALRGGVYSVRAEATGFARAALPSIFLGTNETKKVDLTLEVAKHEAAQLPSSRPPEFFDQPQFTVSGVTDTTSLGGHGSDTIVRTRESLAKETAALGKIPAASSPTAMAALEESLGKRVEQEPNSFEANHALGKALIADAKVREAVPYLERAAQIDPEDYQNSFDLALANSVAGNYQLARRQAQTLLTHHDTAELHHLLADGQEKLGNSLEALREFQRAAEIEPSEPYIFDWGAELLVHHAPEPAFRVFTEGNRRFPRSARMLVGMGAACFARGDYEQAAQRILQASDLTPGDSTPYLFLGKIVLAQSTLSDVLLSGLQRFVTLRPDSAAANYYYAVSLWKQRKSSRDSEIVRTVESLLRKASGLDPKFGAADLQLGIIASERGDFPKAIAEFGQAIQASPDLEEAHYRLAQAYRKTGQTDKAKAQFELYDQLAKESAVKAEQERRELRQFLYTLRDQPASQAQ